MKPWGQDKLVLPPQTMWRYIKILYLNSKLSLDYWVAFFEIGFFIFYIIVLIYSIKRIRLSYWLLFAISIAIPALTGTFQGMPRYGLHLYPLFLSIGIFLHNKNIYTQVGYFAVSLVLLFIFVALFTRGYFIA
jgi:hypothetical protein